MCFNIRSTLDLPTLKPPRATTSFAILSSVMSGVSSTMARSMSRCGSRLCSLPPIFFGATPPVVSLCFSSLIAVEGQTMKRSAAPRRDMPSTSTAWTILLRKSIDVTLPMRIPLLKRRAE